ncbi:MULTISPECIES: hypothetical protein [Sphingomonadaceae]|jgi:hypothetical protein|uniref:hypothetical protein n=1 Tax=Sphingomonadaceae TaxID=41297 RepID=UPI0010BDE9BD|nr:hypothetical protein [Novosphingobium sp. EMRT-2]QCI92939.1 hypothetical protein FA702_04775 [Novosphingobium sp. EMRT-2]
MRIGFLFNHDQVHQVAHSLPIALALARLGAKAEIILATTSARLQAEVIRLGGAAIGGRVTLQPLELQRHTSRWLAAAGSSIVPTTKLLIYRDNLDFFRSLDILVVAEKTSLILKDRYGLDHLKIIHTRHGAGDRAIGFNPESAKFDHVLVSGPKIRDRLIDDAGVDPGRISIVGYPKFDIHDGMTTHGLLNDGKPVVLYNPHVSPHLSSWYRMGRAILDWFIDHEEYHLIFAPHVMLYERPFVMTIDKLRIDRPRRIEERYLRAPNIHIDLGSRASTTMAYTNRADIYLGDVSSQVYEFLRQPRPCVFVDAHRTAWENDPNFAHWSAGPVIGNVADLGQALAQASADHAGHFRPIQEKLFRYSFDLTDERSSDRAARAIAELAGLDRPSSDPMKSVAYG